MRNMSLNVLIVDKVNYHLGSQTILENVSFAVKNGEILSLIGPNGAGKSTLIKLILGLLKPTSGTIEHQGTLGYVPQKFFVPQTLPLRVLDLLCMAHSKVKQTPHWALLNDTLHLNTLLNKQIHHLSGGEMQRVLLARALVCPPSLLILDEPMQGLDPDTEQLLYDFIDTLPQRFGLTLLVVSHDLHWVMGGTSQVVCLNRHICCQGTPETVAQAPEFLQLFGQYRPYIHNHRCAHS